MSVTKRLLQSPSTFALHSSERPVGMVYWSTSWSNGNLWCTWFWRNWVGETEDEVVVALQRLSESNIAQNSIQLLENTWHIIDYIFTSHYKRLEVLQENYYYLGRVRPNHYSRLFHCHVSLYLKKQCIIQCIMQFFYNSKWHKAIKAVFCLRTFLLLYQAWLLALQIVLLDMKLVIWIRLFANEGSTYMHIHKSI